MTKELVITTATTDAVTAHAAKATIGGGIVSMVGGITMGEVIAWGGLLVAVLGVLIQVYGQRHAAKIRDAQNLRDAREHARREREHQVRMDLANLRLKAMQEGLKPPAVDLPDDPEIRIAFADSDILSVDDFTWKKK